MADDVKGREHLVKRQQLIFAIFKRFSSRWQRAFHPNRWPDLLDDWTDGCRRVDTDQLEPMARAFLREVQSQYPPKSWEFQNFVLAKLRKSAESTDGPLRMQPDDPLVGSRPFWFERNVPGIGVVQAQAYQLKSGGSLGISELEMDGLYDKSVRWGWGYAHAGELQMAPREVAQ
ncbi:MAG: hypothetical protein V4617_15200 [Gemmatimonadota bacterium]